MVVSLSISPWYYPLLCLSILHPFLFALHCNIFLSLPCCHHGRYPILVPFFSLLPTFVSPGQAIFIFLHYSLCCYPLRVSSLHLGVHACLSFTCNFDTNTNLDLNFRHTRAKLAIPGISIHALQTRDRKYCKGQLPPWDLRQLMHSTIRKACKCCLCSVLDTTSPSPYTTSTALEPHACATDPAFRKLSSDINLRHSPWWHNNSVNSRPICMVIP